MAFTENMQHGCIYMTSDKISAKHMFTTRIGGVSKGVFASWNLGVHRGDDDAAVCENYRLAGEIMGCGKDDFVVTKQVHGRLVHLACDADRYPFGSDKRIECDGFVTNVKNLPIMIYIADCVPVLLHDPEAEVIAAAYAIIDADGVDACSMRALGSKLGVTAMAVYGYVPSREMLLNEVMARFLERVDTRAVRGEQWGETLLRTMHSLRKACVEHPYFAELMNNPCISDGLELYMMRLRAIYLAQGMPEEIAVQLLSIADAFFAGFCLRSFQRVEKGEEPPAPDPNVHGAGDGTRFATESRVPGMLTGHRAPTTRIVRPNERWRRTVKAGYSERSFENGLFVIIEGIRAGAAPDPCAWRTPVQ